MSKKNKSTFLSFRLGKENFAISVKKVLEVIQKQNITEMPDMPDCLKGVINFRGDILPVLDARMKFKLKNFNTTKFVIIVLEIVESERKQRFSIIADCVKDVFSIEENEIKPIPPMGLSYNIEYVQGMIQTSDGFITILNVEKLFLLQQFLEQIEN